ncbi:MAG: hypothetical protein NTY12_05445 [Candidatus Falkowbacteria bacterium]|nr:hypothetical protein [Candidatus Falkowbacteria bacterium]
MKKLIFVLPICLLVLSGCTTESNLSQVQTSQAETQTIQPTSNNKVSADESLACAQLGPTTLANAISSDGTTDSRIGVTLSFSTYHSYYNTALKKCFVLVSYTENWPNIITYITNVKRLYDASTNTQIADYMENIDKASVSQVKLLCSINELGEAFIDDCTVPQFDDYVRTKMGGNNY